MWNGSRLQVSSVHYCWSRDWSRNANLSTTGICEESGNSVPGVLLNLPIPNHCLPWCVKKRSILNHWASCSALSDRNVRPSKYYVMSWKSMLCALKHLVLKQVMDHALPISSSDAKAFVLAKSQRSCIS